MIARPDGEWFAQLTRHDESAGCHGVGGYHKTTTVARIFDRAGRVIHELTHSRVETSWENQGDSDEGQTIDDIRFAADGAAVVVSLSTGGEIIIAL